MKQKNSLKNITRQKKIIDDICEMEINCTGLIPASKKDLEEISAFIKKEKEQKTKSITTK